MGKKRKHGLLKKFLSSKKEYPVLAAVAAGLYPLFFYYSRNFTMIDSWVHLGYFLVLFLFGPILVFMLWNWIFTLLLNLRWKKYVLPFLNIFVFLFFLKMILYGGLQKKMIIVIFIIAGLIAFFLYKYFKKWLLVQLLLAVVGFFALIPVIIQNFTYSDAWTQLPDAIQQVAFKQKPNVYYIQPDGYSSFSELKKGYYNFDNTEFEAFLSQNHFKSYPNFRSNYDATLASNSATFAMKHHLYSGSTNSGEVTRARNIILSDNSVLRVFKKNGYKTYFFTEFPYLMMNRPKMGYDFSNFSYSDVPFLGTGLENKKNILPEFRKVLGERSFSGPKFFFIEIFNPKHIDGSSWGDNLVKRKRAQYLENLHKANETIKSLTHEILKNDPNALILIMADHGGYVGMERLQQGNVKTADRDKVFSIFGSLLSIHWSKEEIPRYDDKLKTSVNVFRILFSYLSRNTSYLDHLETDSSYGVITEGAPDGVYELINENDSLVFRMVRGIKR